MSVLQFDIQKEIDINRIYIVAETVIIQIKRENMHYKVSEICEST